MAANEAVEPQSGPWRHIPTGQSCTNPINELRKRASVTHSEGLHTLAFRCTLRVLKQRQAAANCVLSFLVSSFSLTEIPQAVATAHVCMLASRCSWRLYASVFYHRSYFDLPIDPSFHHLLAVPIWFFQFGGKVGGRCETFFFFFTDIKLTTSGNCTHAELSCTDNTRFLLVYQCVTWKSCIFSCTYYQ